MLSMLILRMNILSICNGKVLLVFNIFFEFEYLPIHFYQKDDQSSENDHRPFEFLK